jgi:hypothetical protein
VFGSGQTAVGRERQPALPERLSLPRAGEVPRKRAGPRWFGAVRGTRTLLRSRGRSGWQKKTPLKQLQRVGFSNP